LQNIVAKYKGIIMNIPNKITISRIFFSILIFILLSIVDKNSTNYSLILDIALILFIIGGLTDILDGYIARKYNLITPFGRIADPFADKILICGTLICFIPHTKLLAPWVIIIIIGREILVSNLRSYIESLGHQFGANIFGKLKMFIQTITIIALFLYLAHFQDKHIAFEIIMQVLIYLTAVITAFSGFIYVMDSTKILNDAKKF